MCTATHLTRRTHISHHIPSSPRPHRPLQLTFHAAACVLHPVCQVLLRAPNHPSIGCPTIPSFPHPPAGVEEEEEDEDDEEEEAGAGGKPDPVVADNRRLKGEVSKHKAQLEALREKDPEFFA